LVQDESVFLPDADPPLPSHESSSNHGNRMGLIGNVAEMFQAPPSVVVGAPISQCHPRVSGWMNMSVRRVTPRGRVIIGWRPPR
jgi:hypothetical protein